MTRAGGIDVGGTKILGVVVDELGEVIDEHRRPTPDGRDHIVAEMVAVARSLGGVDSLGVGVPGLVDRRGVLRAAPNLVAADETPFGALLSDALGVAVAVDNDSTCATLAEWRFGAAVGCSDVVMIALGTGIGGGIVADGALRRGINGFAGEFGHMVLVPDGEPCPCGRRGCWERYASGSGLRMLAGGRPGDDVVDDARRGDPASVAVLAEFADWLALGLANLTNALDPARIVLGGGVSESSDLWIESVRRCFAEHLYASEHRPLPTIVAAELGEHAGAIGAALLPSLG